MNLLETLEKSLTERMNLPDHLRSQVYKGFRELTRRGREERIRYINLTKPPLNDQEGLYLSKAKVRLGGGGNRSGKSETAVKDCIDFATGNHPVRSIHTKPPVYIRFCAPTWEDSIKEVTLKKFQNLVRRSDLYMNDWRKAWSEKHRTLYFNYDGDKRQKGSIVRFFTGQQDVGTYGGDDLDAVYMDEHLAKKYYTENMARLVDRNGYMVLTMTPEAGMTWEEQEIINRWKDGDPDYGVWFFDSRLNPYLSKEGLASLIKSLESNPQLFEAKIKGHFVALAGLVYYMFKESEHVIDDFDIAKFSGHRQVILDAHEKKPHAILWLHWNKKGEVIAYREAKYKSQGIPDLAKFIRIKNSGDIIQDWIMDESEGGTVDSNARNNFDEQNIITQLNNAGLPFLSTNQASDKSVKQGIEKVREFLKLDPVRRIYNRRYSRFKIFQSCQMLIREFMIYQFRKESPAMEDVAYSERIRKIENDLVDCARYGIMAEPIVGLPSAPKEEYDQDTGRPIYREDYRSPIHWDLE